MRMLNFTLWFLQFAIVFGGLLLIAFISYFNVVEYDRLLRAWGIPAAFSIWVAVSGFLIIQAFEIRPLFLKAKHNKVSQLAQLAESQPDKDSKLLALQLKEEEDIKPKKMRRALVMAYVFTAIDFILCAFFLFTPLIQPGVNLWTVLLTMNPSYILWWNVIKVVATVWMLPRLVGLLLAESEDARIPSLGNAIAALKSKFQENQQQQEVAKPSANQQAHKEARDRQLAQAPASQPRFQVVPYTNN